MRVQGHRCYRWRTFGLLRSNFCHLHTHYSFNFSLLYSRCCTVERSSQSLLPMWSFIRSLYRAGRYETQSRTERLCGGVQLAVERVERRVEPFGRVLLRAHTHTHTPVRSSSSNPSAASASTHVDTLGAKQIEANQQSPTRAYSNPRREKRTYS